jgi:radical SAM superfamily enzyme YgiQ (UPF0313 family)
VDLDYREVADLDSADSLPTDFDAVAISSFSAQIHEAYQLADRYRKLGATVFLGGLHVTACPEEALLHATSVVLGEAEGVWPQVMRDWRSGTLQPVYDARGIAFDLRRAPLPRYDLLEEDRYNRLTVQTQRGCPYDCDFCAASIRLNPRFRVKPVEKVIREIRLIKEIWPHPFIEFADDNTFADKKHGKELLRALSREGIRWFTETDLSIAWDEELLGLMRDGGCAQVLIGFESASLEGIQGVERKSNWKARMFEKYREGIDRIQARGISVNGCFVLGLDGTGLESFDQVRKFVEDSGLHEVQVTIQTPFPGTPLYERLRREGRIRFDAEWELCTLFDVNFVPDRMSIEELERGFRNLVRDLYSEESTARRRSRFKNCLRQRVAGG